MSSLAFDPNNSNIAYATYSTFGGEHVFKSTNMGASWTPIDGTGATGIPDIPVHSVVVDPNNSQRIYVGTDLGVFVTLNGGTTWAKEDAGFANVVVEKLELLDKDQNSLLFAFTHGRSAWRIGLDY